MIGLDTGAIIDLFRGDKKIVGLLENSGETFASTVLNYQELLFGLDPGNGIHKIEGDYYEKLFQNLTMFNLEPGSAKKSSEIFWEMRKRGMDAGKFDAIIAGIFLSNGVKQIVTRNKRHFSGIKELRVVSY